MLLNDKTLSQDVKYGVSDLKTVLPTLRKPATKPREPLMK